MDLARKLRRDAERKNGLAAGKFGRIESFESAKGTAARRESGKESADLCAARLIPSPFCAGSSKEHKQAAADGAAIRYAIEGGLKFAPSKAFSVDDLFTIPKPAPAPSSGPTGPRTPEGKAKCCLNNLRHGLAGAFHVLDHESQSEFDDLAAALRDEHQPATATEAILVQRLAEHYWLSRRAQRLQDGAITANSPANLALFLRYQTTNDRAFHKCLGELSRLRKERRSAAEEFESQKPSAALRHQPEFESQNVQTAENSANSALAAKLCAPQTGLVKEAALAGDSLRRLTSADQRLQSIHNVI